MQYTLPVLATVLAAAASVSASYIPTTDELLVARNLRARAALADALAEADAEALAEALAEADPSFFSKIGKGIKNAEHKVAGGLKKAEKGAEKGVKKASIPSSSSLLSSRLSGEQDH